MSEPAVLVEKVHKAYNFGKVKALNGIDLTIQEGDCFALIGPNGAGKTTLMGCLLALLRPDSGRIKIFGREPDDLDVRRITGFLPERPSFESWLTGAQFLRFHHKMAQRRPEVRDREVREVLESIEMTHAADRKLSKYSRGMLQRIGLGQLLIGKPRLCFLDEPTSGMDPPGMELIRTVLLKLKDEGVTVVVNSHHLDEVERVCNRFAFLRHGTIETQQAVNGVKTRVLVVRWCQDSQPIPQLSRLESLARTNQSEVADVNGEYARFLLGDRSNSAPLIAALAREGIAFEEAFFERASLIDLFKSPTKENGDGGPLPAASRSSASDKNGHTGGQPGGNEAKAEQVQA